MINYPGAFDEEIRAEYGNEAIVDGIVNMTKHRETYPKILWILKEANWAHDEDCPPQLEDYNHREFLKHVYKYTDESGKKLWKNTFKRIILCSYGIIEYENLFSKSDKNPNWLLHFENIPVVNDFAKIGVCSAEVMNRISLINVKKTAGVSSSKDPKIKKSYEEHRDFLLKQIKQIDADVIINCSRVEKLTQDLQKEQYKMSKKKNKEIYFNNEKLLIHYYHPGATSTGSENIKMSDHRYYEDIIGFYSWWRKL